MENLYIDKRALDKRASSTYAITEYIMMENAATSMRNILESKLHKNALILIICGSGDNGGDGYALARQCAGHFNVKIYQADTPKSPNALYQYNLAKKISNISFVDKIIMCDCVLDCICGSGLEYREDFKYAPIITLLNNLPALKVACDIPSGIYKDGKITNCVFKADITISMGALSYGLYSDMAKDYVGEIFVGNLGISRENYETSSNIKLLQSCDLQIPTRKSNNVNKGSFGHSVVYVGDKVGAGMLASHAALSFGSGLSSIVSNTPLDMSLNPEIMNTQELPKNATAIACGMGLGERCAEVLQILKDAKLPCVIDADMCYEKGIIKFIESSDDSQVILTPHVKEFVGLLKQSDIKSDLPLTLESVINDKLNFATIFAKRYPNVVLLLKGANVMIAKNDNIYINPLGDLSLAKGGSGDVLSGLALSLLAQGRDALDAAINASLSHALASQNYVQNNANYSLTPLKLIQSLSQL